MGELIEKRVRRYPNHRPSSREAIPPADHGNIVAPSFATRFPGANRTRTPRPPGRYDREWATHCVIGLGDLRGPQGAEDALARVVPTREEEANALFVSGGVICRGITESHQHPLCLCSTK